jgi:hypothetical protein
MKNYNFQTQESIKKVESVLSRQGFNDGQFPLPPEHACI